MREALRRFRAGYGASPLHLLGLVGSFLLMGYAVALVSHDSMAVRMAAWFGAALIVHDLVLFPLYALADRVLGRALHRARRRAPGPPAVSIRNHLRVPALGAALLLLLFLPGIISQGKGTYLAATGQTQSPYLGRWLIVSAALFVVSAVIYTIRARRAGGTEAVSGTNENKTPLCADPGLREG